MPSMILTAASGSGSFPFGSAITFNNCYAELVTPGIYTRLFGPTNHQRVYRAAWYGFGFAGGSYGGIIDSITWSKWLEFQSDYQDVTPGFLAYGDTFFYECLNGATVSFEVDY